jgi:hypothetical protein
VASRHRQIDRLFAVANSTGVNAYFPAFVDKVGRTINMAAMAWGAVSATNRSRRLLSNESERMTNAANAALDSRP